ncbi:hypothetical protein BC834DRAFT_381252 [Gloeopeniophorella convolvens]|nr:hypothetical protein BC834DRAFT_381252 [Gloeopeniophorella convolvens]
MTAIASIASKRDAVRSRTRSSTRKPSKLTPASLQRKAQHQVHKDHTKSHRGERRSSVYAHAAHRAKRTQWALIAQQTARIVLGDGKYVETRRVPVASTLADASETPQHSSIVPTTTWHIVHDISAQVRSSVLGTTFYPLSEEIPSPTHPACPVTTFDFSKGSVPSVVRRLHMNEQCPTKSPSYRLHDSHIGVLSSISSRRPGSGFLKGGSTSDAILARATSLISSLSSALAQPFFRLLKQHFKDSDPTMAALSNDSMLYSPSVVGFRRDDSDRLEATDDDFDGELDGIPADPTTRELEAPPAVNGQNQRAMGEYAAPYYMNVLSVAPANAHTLRSASHTVPESEFECVLRQTTKARIAKALRLLAARGNSVLVLGLFGHEEGTPAEMVAQIYAELLACPPHSEDPNDGELKDVFQKVVFAIPGKLHSQFHKAFDLRVFEDQLIRSLEQC